MFDRVVLSRVDYPGGKHGCRCGSVTPWSQSLSLSPVESGPPTTSVSHQLLELVLEYLDHYGQSLTEALRLVVCLLPFPISLTPG